MHPVASRLVFLFGVGVLMVLFFAPLNEMRSGSEDGGRSSVSQHRVTLGLPFSPWCESLDRREVVALPDGGSRMTGSGGTRLIWASWSWLLLGVAVTWFW